ncbi:MAG: hypothetical protein ABW069_14260 [Duganella sp.]
MRKRLLFMALACATATAHAAEPDWHPFQWVMGSLTGGPPERLGMLLPVTVDGMACTVQLDTGANGEWNWHRGGPATAATGVRALVDVGGLRRLLPASVANLAPIKDGACGSDPIAIVGNGLFENGTLTLDLGRARYAYTPQPLLAQARDAQPLLYLSWAEGGGHILVEVQRAGMRAGYAMLDTGAARFGLVAPDEQQWRALAGGVVPPEDDPHTMRFPGPVGEPVVCREAPMAGGLDVAGTTLTMRAGYCSGHSFTAPIRMMGVLGMAALGDRTIVLDYLSRRWTLGQLPN